MTGSPPPPRWWSFLAALLALAFGARAEADILLLPSESYYEAGERVDFALINNSKDTITLPSATWWQITDDGGDVVDGCDAFPQEHEVQPGDFVEGWWDQVSCANDNPVPQGLYRIDVTYASECCPGETFAIEAYFDIGTAPVAPASWGRIKAAFASGVR